MGQKHDTKTEADENKPAAVDGSVTVVLKLDLHCDGCAKKVRKSVLHFEGVESVEADAVNNKLTVTGKVDPTRIKERVEHKTKKKVEIISPQPTKDAGKPPEKNSDEKKAGEEKPKEIESSTVVLKMPLHCDGCINKIKRIISKIDGVESVIPDSYKNLVTVKGTMNMKEVTPRLKEKFKRIVDIIPPKKEVNKDGEKKDYKNEGGGDDGGGGGIDDDNEKKKNDKLKVSDYGHNPYTYTMPAYNQNYYDDSYGVISSSSHAYANQDYTNHGYMTEYPSELPPHDHRASEIEMFSEENPNACSIM